MPLKSTCETAATGLYAAAAIVLTINLAFSSKPVAAQRVIGFDPSAGPICDGPRGVAPCEVIRRWMEDQARGAQGNGLGPPPGTGSGIHGLPGAGLLPQDGQIAGTIAQSCGGEPRCMALAWGSVEVQRCRNGLGTEGGCFGPNGEIMKIVNRFLPQHLQPNVIIKNMESDLNNGPGENNDLVGCNGFVPRLFGSRC